MTDWKKLPRQRVARSREGRRSQVERSADTKLALLEAGVEVLAQKGYARFSTSDVARRAGVSRGGQLHHYPSKRDLVGAIIEHVFETREAAFLKEFGNLERTQRTLEKAVEILWKVFQGDTYKAMTELIVAARSDYEIRVRVIDLFKKFISHIQELSYSLFPDIAESPFGNAIVGLAFSTLLGASLIRDLELNELSEDIVSLLRFLASYSPAEVINTSQVHSLDFMKDMENKLGE